MLGLVCRLRSAAQHRLRGAMPHQAEWGGYCCEGGGDQGGWINPRMALGGRSGPCRCRE